MLLYLAKLKVIHAGRTHFFNTAKEVWDWLEIRGLDRILPRRLGGDGTDPEAGDGLDWQGGETAKTLQFPNPQTEW